MKRYVLIIFYLLWSINGFAGGNKDTIAEKFAVTISAEDLKKHLYIIASDEFEGRETGKEGQKKAADYISKIFKEIGLEPGNKESYFQQFPLIMQDPKGVDIFVGDKKYEFLKDFYYFPGFGDTLLNFKEITFLGYGINHEKYNDYKDKDVTGKLLLILNGEPVNSKKVSFLTGTKDVSEWTINQRSKGRLAAEKGASAVFIVVDDVKENLKTLKYFIENPTLKLDNLKKSSRQIPVFYISKEMAAEVFKNNERNIADIKKDIDKKGKAISTVNSIDLKLKINRESQKITSENVLGFIEGSDLKNEILVITSHYDHLGKDGDKIYYGADDDGSGTVSVLEIAEAFAKAKAAGRGPRRSILFMPFSGEEKGLLGSQFYVENPIFSLENTICNLNIDMVGRVDKKHKNNPDFVYLIGSDKLSTELHSISENANVTYTNIELDYTYNHPDDPNRFYYRSDHYNFAKNNIPVIFYFNGSHDDYHKTTDTPDKINYDVMEKRARLIFYTAWELANRTERIKVDVTSDFK
jgi:hypothetical protein